MHQCIKFILFWNDTLHVSNDLSIHHQDLKTVHTATGICQTDTAVCCKEEFECLLNKESWQDLFQTSELNCAQQVFLDIFGY